MSYIQDVVKSVGEERAKIKKVDESDVNKWGDAESTETGDELTGVFELVSAEREEVAEGDFEAGDLRAYVPSYENLSEGDILVYQGKDYRVQTIQEMEVGSESHFEIGASRT